MERRTVLISSASISAIALGGCIDGSVLPTQEGEDDREYEDENDTGTAGVAVSIEIVEGPPKNIVPIESSDERISEVELITKAIELVESEEDIRGNKLVVTEFPRDTDKARDALKARDRLPSHKNRGTYLTHGSRTLLLTISNTSLD